MRGSMKNANPAVVCELLSPATINLDLKSKDRDSVLGELVNQIPQLAAQPEARQTLLRALREREQLCSTGIGDGVALPHSRNALVGLVAEPMMVFGRHPQGIPYGDTAPQPGSPDRGDRRRAARHCCARHALRAPA